MKNNNKSTSARANVPIVVSHPDKIFWPEEGYTKLDLIEYYSEIFPSCRLT